MPVQHHPTTPPTQTNHPKSSKPATIVSYSHLIKIHEKEQVQLQLFNSSKKPQKSCLSNATCHSSPLPNGANSLSQGPKVLKKKSQTVHDFPGALKALEGQNGGLLLNHHFGDHPVASWAKILRGTPGDNLWHDVGMGQSWVIGPKRKQKELVN